MLKERTIHRFVRSPSSQFFIFIFNSFGKTAETFSSLKVLAFNSFGKMAETFSSLKVLGFTAARVMLLRTWLENEPYTYSSVHFLANFSFLFSIHLGRQWKLLAHLRCLDTVEV